MEYTDFILIKNKRERKRERETLKIFLLGNILPKIYKL